MFENSKFSYLDQKNILRMSYLAYFQRSTDVKIIHFSMGGNAALYCSRKVPGTTTKKWEETIPEQNDLSKKTSKTEEVKYRWYDLILKGEKAYNEVEIESFDKNEMVIAVTCNADLKSNDVVYQFCNELERKFHEHFFDIV